MNEVIAIRADGNSEIGFGHLMRMNALAHELIKKGAKVIFLSRNPENIEGYPVLGLNKQAGDEEDLVSEEMLTQIQAGMLIIDSYVYRQKQLDRVGQLDLFSVYVDDLNRHPFNTDLVLNGNLYATNLDYRGKAQFILGAGYLLMREGFARLPARRLARRVENILITFGAADSDNVTPRILQLLDGYEQFRQFEWHVAIGPVFSNAAQIETAARNTSNVVLYHNPDLKKLMDFCDISISAAGSTTYELAACGIPSLLLVTADNQVMLAAEAERQGMAINLGPRQNLDRERLYSVLDSLINNRELREKMAARGQELIDGRGAERVAAILIDEMRRRKYGHTRDHSG